MTKFLLILLVAFFCSNALQAQEKEITAFKKDLNFYIDFLLKKFDSLPLNKANQEKFMRKADQSFKTFALAPNSQQYEKLVQDRGLPNRRFSNLDNRIELYVSDFTANKKAYVVYSYVSYAKRNYVIKDVAANSIVYEGNAITPYVENIYGLDSTHVLLIEKTGDRNTSKQAVVFLTTGKTWKMMPAFRGEAFGQVPGNYNKKVFVKQRNYFQLDCEMEVLMSAPADANKIYFDERTKTISYKKFTGKTRFRLIESKWLNNMFILDDYDVSEDFESSSPMVPGG
ncbi:hypothetical protein [Ferruginibacter sp. HRS2-29]|uniref:hypothetical protein n=1 Tax=Ferruginibacter sp. HRS2-29 TaxID=2487334 RepID=UPI0020CCC4C4|nr:hypothetical protein [Ferruginibacter sp. HRS2-29]MCP9753356.1 hypothetical protein [Ferruginibacter sp. HRS2-29]